MQNSARLLTNAVIAAVIGSTIGALAGVWSAYHVTAGPTPLAPVATTQTVAPASSVPPAMKTMEPTSVRREPQAAPTTRVSVPAPSVTALTAPPSKPKVWSSDGANDVLERARALAQRPDVTALVALRENVVAHATERGERDSAATKQQLDALDRYIDEARVLRLKLDAIEFQKSASESKATRPPSARR